MYCKKCGTELRGNDEFCYYCGERTGFFQRIFSTKAVIGSAIALVVVMAAGVFTYLILSGKLQLPIGGSQDEVEDFAPVATATVELTASPEPTATPYVFRPSVVTKEMKAELKPLTKRLMPFLAYSASYYANGAHAFRWDRTSATVMALFNLERCDKTVKYGDSMNRIQKNVKREMKKLFGTHYKYKLVYAGTYPSYVYRQTGDTLVFNTTSVNGKGYRMEVKKITEYEEGKYRVLANAYLVTTASGVKGTQQKYTITIERDATSEYGYVVTDVKLYQK